MEPLQHWAGIFGAVTGTLLPVSASHGVSPAPFSPAVVVVEPSAPVWRPWIDDLAGARPAGDPDSCRTGPRDGILPLLLEAPLPHGYEPERTPGEMYACVLVAPSGGVAAVRLAGTTGDRGMDASLISAIGYGWRFVAGSDRREWVRVRLDAGAVEGGDLPPLLPL